MTTSQTGGVRLEQATLPMINPFDPAYVADPYGTYANAAAESWIASCPLGAMVLGQEEMKGLLRDNRLIEPRDLLAMFGVVEGPFHEWFTTQMVMAEGEDHARLRRLIAGAFRPANAEMARPLVATILDEHIGRVEQQGVCDFVTDISGTFPLRVFCRMIGVPEEDVVRFQDWATTLGFGMDVDVSGIIADLDEAMEGLRQYVADLVQRSRQTEAGEPNLLQNLALASEDGSRLTSDELVSLIILLLIAGSDTTANAVSWAMVVLLDHPNIWERMGQEPEIVPRVVEEALRFRPPATVTGRIATEELQFEGLVIPAGTYLMLANAAANNDPRAYHSPETFDIDRTDAGHLAFGYGPHSCVGSHLARAELREAFAILPRRLRNPRLAGEVVYGTPLGIHSVKSMPIVFDAVNPPSPSTSASTNTNGDG